MKKTTHEPIGIGRELTRIFLVLWLYSAGATLAAPPKPEIYIFLEKPKIGQNVAVWSPVIAAAMKCGRYSKVHVISITPDLIPAQRDPDTGTEYVPHLQVDRELREVFDRIGAADVVISDSIGTWGTPNPILTRGYAQAKTNGTRVFTISSDEWENAPGTVESYGASLVEHFTERPNQTPGAFPPQYSVTDARSRRDVRALFGAEPPPEQRQTNERAETRLFAGGDRSQPFDMFNLQAVSQDINVTVNARHWLALMEERLRTTENNLVIAPYGAPSTTELRQGLNALKNKYRDRIFDASEFRETGFYPHLLKRAAHFFTPDTGAAWLARKVNPAALCCVLYKGRNATPAQAAGQWFSADGTFLIGDPDADPRAESARLNRIVGQTTKANAANQSANGLGRSVAARIAAACGYGIFSARRRAGQGE